MIDRKIILSILWKYYGVGTKFREGQDKAILAALSNKRALIVQKTGWGKSLVYFLTTRILRDRGEGPAIVISPLLSLMGNQLEAARKFNLKAESINSTNNEEWDEIIFKVLNNSIDILFISPERLANNRFISKVLLKIEKNISMLVIDEAHCISDWGHDFRPDYRRIINIVRKLPKNVPVIATTATANNRVIDDIKLQLGDDLEIIRGPLTRESISIDIIKLDTQAERLAWLSENLEKLEGTGIIYTLTVSDTKIVTEYLRSEGYEVEEYYGGLVKEEREEKEEKLINNKIKALVATVALGMGYDKSDISFVIHYQKPGNVVAYYQQIGRAGRAIESSDAILLCGEEDDDISNYFIESAFPTEKEMVSIVRAINEYDGLSENEILAKVNMKSGRLKSCLKYLDVDGAIYKDLLKYYPTINNWKPNLQYSNQISDIRRYELKRMNDYIDTKECLMEFIAKELDDENAYRCGKCKNCRESKFKNKVDFDRVLDAISFLKGSHLIIEPRKMWPKGICLDGSINSTILKHHRMEEGVVLSSYGDSGWGKLVKDGKYIDNHFNDELVEASANILKDKIDLWGIDTVVYIPSLRRENLVKDFAIRLAKKLNIKVEDVIIKIKDTTEQKKQENSYYQCSNAIEGFGVKDNLKDLGNVLLVDDMVDSKWTFTYCTYLLRESGYAKNVYPYALARTGK